MSAPDPIEPLSPMVVGPSSRRIQAIGAVMYLIAAFLFALNGSVAKAQIEAGLSPAEVTEIRTIGCALLLLIYILIVNPGSLKVRRTEIPFLLLFGVLAYALTPFLFFLSVELLPVAIAALLAFLAPVLVALWLRYVKREAVGRSIWLSLVLVVGGLILVSQVWSGMTLNPLGVFFGLLTAAALAAYLILGEAGARRRDVMSLAFWGFAIATVTWSILAPWWNFPWNLLTTTTSLFDGAVTGIPVWSLVIVMIAISVIPFVLVLMSLQRIGAQRGGILGTT
ncbi:MAG: DMT family transporter, partial [Candidatus Nanopelagicales bacterium]|nr:DMT family transporter [Candidatus Nanopelagicales bacterium]